VVDRPLARLAQKDLDYPLKLAGLSAGAYQLARVTYLHLEPRFDYPFLDGDLLVNVAIPLNFLIYDETVPEELAQEGMGTLRDADWDELPGDLLRVFRRLEYGHPEAPLWLRLGGNEPITLGQGALLRRVGGELALDRVQPVAGVGWKHPAGGLLLLTPDASTWEVLAVQGSLAPARLFTPDPFWGGLLFSVSYAFDRDAPFALRHAASGKVVYDRQGRPSVDETVFLQAVGATLQLDLLRSPRLLLQQYLDYSAISGRGGAFTVGLLQRYSFADELFALEVRTELLTHDADYLPGYFDELYLVEREGVVSERLSAGDLPKAAYLQSLTGLPRRVGYQLELAAAFPGWAALAAALQDVNEGRERRLLLHGEVPATRWLHLFLTYEKRNFAALLPLFDFNEDNQVFYHGIRLSLTPWAALCYRAQRAYQVDLNARERKNVFHFQVDAEVGWGF